MQRCRDQDLEIQGEAAVLDVPEVELDATLHISDLGRSAARTVDLSPSRDARPHGKPLRVAWDERAIVAVVSERVRTWANEAHLAAQHVKKLRQFVEAGLTQTCAQPGQSRIAALGLPHDNAVLVSNTAYPGLESRNKQRANPRWARPGQLYYYKYSYSEG